MTPDSGKFDDAVQPGVQIGSYRVDAPLGKGGMGVVYLATDTRLDRRVAIKFLSKSLLDADARRRFQHEARMASALNHPHILSVYDVGEYDGLQYLVTEFIDNGTLDTWTRSEPRAWPQVVDLLIGVAEALAAAHAARIVHRDIKPGNILVSRAGYAKLADFGLAKPTEDAARGDSRAYTQPGALIGTAAYMSPEQIAGRAPDARSDIFSFGVVLYELLARRRPFVAGTDLDVMYAIVHAPAQALPGDVPEALRAIVDKALEKEPAARYQSMRDLVADLRRVARTAVVPSAGAASSNARAPAPERRRRSVAALITIALVVVLSAGYLFWNRSDRARWARDEAIPEIARLTDEGDFRAAFDLARQARGYAPDDSLLRTLTPIFTASYKIMSTPADANVLVRGYDATDEDWQSLGRTPLPDAQLARRPLRWRIEKQGFEPAELATSVDDDYLGTNSIAVTLQTEGTHPDMVFVPGGNTVRSVNRIVINMPAMGPFFIDRYEVTNVAYKEFVDAGGYERSEYWTDLELGTNAVPSSWADAMDLFVDTTGEQGPATWELGSFPEGREQYPVTGISWYEAAAYARFRGKTLPTVYHWAKAALPEVGVSALPAAIVPLSNYGTAGPAAVGTYQGLGPYGTYDLHGNVGEWTFNRRDPGRAWVLGGSWQDPAYNFSVAAFPHAVLERPIDAGFRLVLEASDAAPEGLRDSIDFETSPDLTRTPATDEVYSAYAQQFSYTPGNPDASNPITLEETNDWVKQRVTLDTGYGERMDVYLFLPKRSQPPYQALVYFPPLDAVALKLSTEGLQPGNAAAPLDFVVKSGRAFVHPIYKGTFDRFERPFTGTDAIFLQRRWAEWRSDMGRTIDYLEARADIDAQRIGYVGISFGASWPLYLPALESRFRVALLLAGGLLPAAPPAPSVDPVHYAPRITMPVLMMNGRFDNTFTTDLQLALFRMLGTPSERKRQVIVENAGHVVPRSDVLRESVKWLDEYLGPVR